MNKIQRNLSLFFSCAILLSHLPLEAQAADALASRDNSKSWQFNNTIRDGLHPMQYYSLAKYFLGDYDLDNAQKCVRKLKAMKSNKQAADLAFRLEDTWMPKYPPSKEALAKFRSAVFPRFGPDTKNVCTELTQQFPKFEWSYAVLANMNRGFSDEALRKKIPFFKKILEINPHNIQALLALTDIEQRSGHRSESLKYFQLAKTYNPEVEDTDESFLKPPSDQEFRERLKLNNKSRVMRRENPKPIPFDQSSLPTEKSYRFIDKSGSITFRVGPNASTADRFSDGLLLVNGSENKGSYQSEDVQYWDKNGELVFNVDYGDGASASEGLCAIQRQWFSKEPGTGWGFVDKSGKAAIAISVSETKSFSNGLAAVQCHQWNSSLLPPTKIGSATWGFIDKDGKWQAEPIYNDVDSYSEGLSAVSLCGKIGYIDKTGRFVIQPLYDQARPFSEGLANVTIIDELSRTWDDQYIDKSGRIVFRIKTVIAGDRPLREHCENGVLNGYRSRVMVRPDERDNLLRWDFHEGLVVTEANGKWGYKDRTGKVVIQPRFDSAFQFANGLARVRTGELYGFIDKNGTFVVPAQFKAAANFADGLACVSKDGRLWGYIDSHGTYVIKPIYTEAHPFSEGLAKVGVDK